MGCFLGDSGEGKPLIPANSGKRPNKVPRRLNDEGEQPIKAIVLVDVSVNCLMSCFQARPPLVENGPSQQPIRGSSLQVSFSKWGISQEPGSSLGTSPCTRTMMTTANRSHTQQNRENKGHFLKSPSGQQNSSSFVQSERPMNTARKRHNESDTCTR